MKVKKKFVDVHNYPNWTPPTRVYVHRAGFPDVWGSDTYQGGLKKTSNYFVDTYLSDHLTRMKYSADKFNFLLGVMWGNETDKMMDLFGFKYDRVWPGNPEVHGFVIKNGVQLKGNPVTNPLTCGDSLILLGEEEKHRRTCSDLTTYILELPDISFLNNEK